MRRIADFIHLQPGWPQFHWDSDAVAARLATVRFSQGLLVGQMGALGFSLRQEAILETLTSDVLKSSEIEGEKLDLSTVRSSVARHLGIQHAAKKAKDRNVEGVVEMMLDATTNFSKPLTEERLFAWHTSLFPTGHSGLRKIRVGAWRDAKSGAMQVISGPLGNEHLHFEAPSWERLHEEMTTFLNWFNLSQDDLDPLLKAAQAHLWFVTIHPFEDGNGRIARAIADLQLARSESSPQRFYSMSQQIQAERQNYYEILEKTQKGAFHPSDPFNITEWMSWFLECLGRAIAAAEQSLQGVLTRARFWDRMKDVPLNARQRIVLNRMLEGFEGNLTTSKWAQLSKSSHDTALRDIQDLLNRGILIKSSSAGRSTHYELKPLEYPEIGHFK